MTEKAFLDTNLFVYVYTDGDKEKHNTVSQLMGNMLIDSEIYISTQVLNEFYVSLAKYRRTHEEITGFINEITQAANVRAVSLPIVEQALRLKGKYGYSLWDSLILASALESGCALLFSEDLQHNQIIEGSLRIRNPFVNVE